MEKLRFCKALLLLTAVMCLFLASYQPDVQAADAASGLSGASVSAKSSAPELKISIDREEETFTLSWKPLKGAGKIQILRAGNNGIFKLWKTVPAKNGKVKCSYRSLKAKQRYVFALRACYKTNAGTVYSKPSNAYSIIFVELEKPTMKLSINQAAKTMTFSWKPIKEASKIQVLRKDGEGAKRFKIWKTVSAKKSKATFSYRSLEKGKKYYFALRAYTKSSGGGLYSEPSNGTYIKLN